MGNVFRHARDFSFCVGAANAKTIADATGSAPSTTLIKFNIRTNINSRFTGSSISTKALQRNQNSKDLTRNSARLQFGLRRLYMGTSQNRKIHKPRSMLTAALFRSAVSLEGISARTLGNFYVSIVAGGLAAFRLGIVVRSFTLCIRARLRQRWSLCFRNLF